MSERLELFPVAIATYADTRFQRLSVGTEVAKIAAALADFDIHTVEWDTESDQRGHKAVNNRLKRWAESSVPQTVLYWVGHGWSDGRDTALAHTDSPVVVDTEGFTPRQIAKTIATRGSNIANDDAVAGGQPWIIVVVDACRSAAFVRELKAEMMRRAPGLGVGYLLIGGLSGEGATTLGRFSQELRFFLETVCATDFIIPLHRMAVHFQTQGAEVEQKWLIDEVVLHRRHAMLVNLDLDTRHQLLTALDALDDDELRHFLPKAYGGEMPFTETMLGEQSWYFQGRHEETRRITDWLNQAETGMLIVTGSAGSGKSALLGHLIVHANATLRTALQRANLTHPLPATEQPPDNVFDAVLHLTGATMDEVVARLSALTGLRTSTAFIRSAHGLDEALNHLIEEIGRLKRPVTILVDALDEAVEPLLVASRILVVLANTPRVRIVVGTRGSTREAPDQSSSDSDILDTLQSARSTTVQISADATAVANYVRARLQSSRIPLIDPAGVRIDLDALVAQVHKRAPQFLFARLLVHELLADPHQRTAAAWTRLLAGNHRSLFATAVTRLTTDRPVLMAVLKALAFARGRGLPAADDIWLFAAQALNTDPATAVNNNDIDQLTHVAAAYILADREHGQTVFRMAHRTFTEYFTNDIDPTAFDRDHHNEITNALITNAIRQTEEVLAGTRSLNPYYTHYLPAHAAAAGQQGWDVLNRHTALLITLDPGAVAANAWRSSSGRYPLPETISAITTLNTHLQPLHPRDRYLPIQIENHHTRHQTPPAWTPPITVEATTNAPSSPHRILTGHTDPVRALAFVEIPDGRTLLASTGDDDTVRLWDPATGRAHGQPLIGHTGSVRALTSVVLPDEHTLLASGGDDDTVRLWDPTTNRANGRPLTGHTGSVRALTSVILPDGETLLASGGEDRTVRLWLPSNSQERSWPLRGHTGAVRAITSVVLSDGRALLASGGDDRTIRLWDPANTWRNREPLTGHIGAVRALTSVVLRNGHTLIASSGDDRTVRLWDPATNRAHGRPMTGHTGAVRALTSVVLRNGHTLIASSGDDRTVRLWDPATNRAHGRPLTGHTDWVRTLTSVVLPTGHTLLASAGNDSTVRVWDSATARPHRRTISRLWRPRGYISHDCMVLALASVMLPNGRTLLASGGDDRTVRLWDPATNRTHHQPLTDHSGAVRALTSVNLPSGLTFLASGGDDRTVRLWNPATNRAHGYPLTGHTGPVQALTPVMLPDGKTALASGGDDRALLLWDLETGRVRHRLLKGHTEPVRALTSVRLSDGQILLASGGDDRELRLWNPVTGRSHGRPLIGHTGPVRALTSVALPNGETLLVSAGDDRTVRLWNLAADEVAGLPLPGHTGPIRALTSIQLPDKNTLLASTGYDGTVRLWNITNSGAVLKHTISPVPVPIVAGHGIGDRLVLATSGGVIVLRLYHPSDSWWSSDDSAL